MLCIGRAGLIDDNIGQATHDPFMGTRDAADMSHTRKFSQLAGSLNGFSGSDLCGRSGIAIFDVAVNCRNMIPRFLSEAQPYRPHDFQSAAICSSVASVPRPSRILCWMRTTSRA